MLQMELWPVCKTNSILNNGKEKKLVNLNDFIQELLLVK